MIGDAFKAGDKVVLIKEHKFKGLPQTVVGMAGDYVRTSLDQDPGIVTSWLPQSLRMSGDDDRTVFKFVRHGMELEITDDSGHGQIWLHTQFLSSRVRGPLFKLNLNDATDLRNALDAWIGRQG